MDNEGRLITVFRQALNLPPEIVVEGLEYRKTPQWDSLAHMQLIAAIETEFDLMLETDDILAMSSFSKAREIVSGHGNVIEA